jgi:hypothetical protein
MWQTLLHKCIQIIGIGEREIISDVIKCERDSVFEPVSKARNWAAM